MFGWLLLWPQEKIFVIRIAKTRTINHFTCADIEKDFWYCFIQLSLFITVLIIERERYERPFLSYSWSNCSTINTLLDWVLISSIYQSLNPSLIAIRAAGISDDNSCSLVAILDLRLGLTKSSWTILKIFFLISLLYIGKYWYKR